MPKAGGSNPARGGKAFVGNRKGRFRCEVCQETFTRRYNLPIGRSEDGITIVLSKLAATSPDKTISIPTDGLIMAKGETSQLLRNELDYLDSAERELLLKQAGIMSHIGATQALALKAGIGISWTKLECLRR
ncbi:hypothetical protein EMCRGX_G010911 [Ephydatia muelleri]